MFGNYELKKKKFFFFLGQQVTLLGGSSEAWWAKMDGFLWTSLEQTRCLSFILLLVRQMLPICTLW